jgi:hypothetical protein
MPHFTTYDLRIYLFADRVYENDGNHRTVSTIDGNDWEPGMFYGAFYTFVLVMNQVAVYYAAEFAFLYNWQQFYFYGGLCFI